jgi:hypothetical protein
MVGRNWRRFSVWFSVRWSVGFWRVRSVGALATIEWTEMVGRLAAKSVREVQAWWYFEVFESELMVGSTVRLFPGIDLGSVPPIAEI